MSLIAEALKAAQREREGREAELAHRARTLLRPGTLGWGAPLDGTERRRSPGLWVLLGGGGVAGLAVVFLLAPSADLTGSRTRGAPGAQPRTTSEQAISPANPALSDLAAGEPPARAQSPASADTSASTLAPPAGSAGSEERTQRGEQIQRAALQVSGSRQRTARAEEERAANSGRLRVSVPSGAEGSAFDRLFEEGLKLHRAARYREALEVYERASVLDPRDPRVFNNIGAVRRSLGQLEEARQAFRRAIELDPRYAAAWSNLGLVLEALGQREEAAIAFQTALGLDPGNPSASVNLAIQYHEAGLWDEAQRLLEEAVRRDPLMPEAHYELGRLSEAKGDLERARLHYQHFLDLGAARFPEIAAKVRTRLERLSR